MPLMICPDCGNEVSSRAESCPKCGCPREYFESPASATPLEVGGSIEFGSYAGARLRWRVVDVADDKALLLCESAVEGKCYDDGGKGALWSDCTLREWLNEGFLEGFSDAELARIREYDALGPDRVFCLSIEEAQRYMPTAEERLCKPEPRLLGSGILVAEDNGACCWWLRSTGEDIDSQALVITSGEIFTGKAIAIQSGRQIAAIIMERIAVRPAMWVAL